MEAEGDKTMADEIQKKKSAHSSQAKSNKIDQVLSGEQLQQKLSFEAHKRFQQNKIWQI